MSTKAEATGVSLGERLAAGFASSAPARWAAAGADRAFAGMLRAQGRRGRRRNPAESLGHAERVDKLVELAQRIDGLLAATGQAVFRPARAIEPALTQVRELPEGGQVQDALWPSEHQTLLPELQERYVRHPETQRGAARLLLHRERRPMAVLIHGYMTGQYAVEQRMWPVRWLFRQGLDLALFVLPLHGVRAIRARRGAPPFPSADPRFTNEGFRHALADLVDLHRWLRHRGHPSVGVMGMSLGGYTTALAATVLGELAFAVPIIPVSSLADFARDQGRLGTNDVEAAEEHRHLEAVHRMVDPLARAPQIDGARVLVVAGEVDRVTPRKYAARLAAHFEAPLLSWPGGHLLQLGQRQAFREVLRRLTELDALRLR